MARSGRPGRICQRNYGWNPHQTLPCAVADGDCSAIGKKDPGEVVIDKVVGQLITYAMVPYFIGPMGIVLGFIFFRAFDIIKPYPIRKLEKLPSGLGIVVDDIGAGFYAGTALAITSTLFFLHILP